MATPIDIESALLPCLQKAADGRAYRELTTSSKKTGTLDGVFPVKGGKELVAAARERGLIEPRPDPDAPPPKKGKEPKLTHVRITPTGRAWLLERLSPKAAMETLSRALESRSKSAPTDDANALLSQVTELKTAVDRLHSGLAEAASQRRDEAANWEKLIGSLEAKLHAGLDEVRALSAAAPELPPPVPPTPGPDTAQLEGETGRATEPA